MDTTFSFLGLTGYAYGLHAALAAACLLGGMYAFARRRFPAGTVGLFGLLAIALGLVGARALYCLCNLSSFLETYENPWLMLRFFDGGLSLPGVVVGTVLAAALTARVMKIRMAELLDAACLLAGLALALLRLGERYTDLGIGKAVSEGFATARLPWLFVQSRMGVAVEYRMNVWLYEALAGVAICAATLALRRRLQRNSGDTAWFFAALFGASQVLLESLRDDGHMLLIFLRVGQLGAAALPLAACARLARRAGRKRRVVTWTVMAACVAAVALLEFSLDGRLTIGTPSLARDYAWMAAVCAVLFAMPCSLLWLKERGKEDSV